MVNAGMNVPLLGPVLNFADRNFRNKHTKFFNNFQLAFCVAGAVVFFSLPMNWPDAYNYAFGNPWTCYGPDGIHHPSYYGTMYNTDTSVCQGTSTCNPTEAACQNANGAAWDLMSVDDPRAVTHGEDNPDWRNNCWVWCGAFPRSWVGYWPGVVQMIVFTVYCNVGTTVQQAWQGVSGTFLAVMNIWIMKHWFPYGVRNIYSDLDDWTPVDSCEAAFPFHSCSPTAFYVFCFVDTSLVLFGFLFSTAAENSMKFGMSWHIYFMMSFMARGPPRAYFSVFGEERRYIFWDAEETTVLFSGLAGASLAVLATLLPEVHWAGMKPTFSAPKLLNIKRVDNEAADATELLFRFLENALDYFTSGKKTSESYWLSARNKELQASVGTASGHLDVSWWEQQLFCCQWKKKFAKRRANYSLYDEHLTAIVSSMRTVETAVMEEGFDDAHKKFSATMKTPMFKVVQCTKDLLLGTKVENAQGKEEWFGGCIYVCKHGTEGEKAERAVEQLKNAIKEVQNAQVAMQGAFNTVSENQISETLAHENLVAVTISKMALTAVTLANKLLNPKSETVVTPATIFSGLVEMMRKLAWPLLKDFKNNKDEYNDHFNFATRNFVSIMICFFMGYFMEGAVFSRYSGTMASTLSLLISHFSGSAFAKNIKRLLGVTLGKVLPLLMMSLVLIVGERTGGCGSYARFFLHLFFLFGYMLAFNYIYYASVEWTFVGCLIAGFGCNILVSQCNMSTDYTTQYADRYKEIGQVTVAILVQFMVDHFFKSAEPRDIAIVCLDTMNDNINQALNNLSRSSFDDFEKSFKAAQTYFVKLKAIVPECDPAKVVIPPVSKDFQHTLLADALPHIGGCLSNLEMIKLTLAEWNSTEKDQPTKNALLDVIINPGGNNQGTSGTISQRLLTSFATSSKARLDKLKEILAEKDENADVEKAPRELINIPTELEHKRDVYTDLNNRITAVTSTPRAQGPALVAQDPQANVTVILNCLVEAKKDLAMITPMCLQAAN